MKNGDLLFWLWLAEALGPACRCFRQLIHLYDNPYDLFHADESELERIPELTERVRLALSDKNLTKASAIMDNCEKLGIGILTYGDEAYPRALREIKTPPVLLYYSGELPDLNRQLCIGMVGTRKMSAYGLRTAYKIGYELSAANVLVVSGMATGIDGVSAAAAMAGKGKTVAVFGCGVDVVYPKHHAKLMDEIRRNGVLLSEYPPGTRPNSYHFPVRNRIISGISQGTVVVEAGIGSGSLITAKEAILQGRPVFALPANVGSAGAEGTNGLLRDGALLALGCEDILKPYQYLYAETLALERLRDAAKHSGADLAYLSELGVIEWSGNPASVQTAHLRAVVPPETPKKPKRIPQRKKVSTPPEPTAETTPKEETARENKRATPDEVLSSLSPVQLAVLQAIPDDRAISADSLNALGYPYGDTIAALTMLEIMGLIQKLPGALYTKA
ncbi:MAG: DNA-processing protein DprA [Clostridia bacterium]|nr:DNA-processing protein DprA [Clostridia bacterium]